MKKVGISCRRTYGTIRRKTIVVKEKLNNNVSGYFPSLKTFLKVGLGKLFLNLQIEIEAG